MSMKFGEICRVPGEVLIEEQATGMHQNGVTLGAYYAGSKVENGVCRDPGQELSLPEAIEYLRSGGSVGVPNAGAGSYRSFFSTVGCSQVKPVNQCSSAGDWEFAVLIDSVWCAAFQSNRYPYHGFNYGIDFSFCAETFEEFCNRYETCAR